MPRPKPPFEVRCINNTDNERELTVGSVYTVTKTHGADFDRISFFQLTNNFGREGNYLAERFEIVKDKFDILVNEVMRAVNTLRIFTAGPAASAKIILIDGLKKVGIETVLGEVPTQPVFDLFASPFDVICTSVSDDDIPSARLTIGKTYKVIAIREGFYLIQQDDGGSGGWFYQYRFEQVFNVKEHDNGNPTQGS